MAVGFEASLGLGSNVGYGETVSQKKFLFGCFFLFFFVCSISIYQAVVAGLRDVDTECTVPSFRMLKQSLGSAGLV